MKYIALVEYIGSEHYDDGDLFLIETNDLDDLYAKWGDRRNNGRIIGVLEADTITDAGTWLLPFVREEIPEIPAIPASTITRLGAAGLRVQA